MNERRERILLILVIVYAVYVLFPTYWLFINSFKLEKDIFTVKPALIPLHPTIHNYIAVLRYEVAGVGFLRYLYNSLIISTAVTLLSIVLGGVAAYGMSRSRSLVIYLLPLPFLIFSLTPPQVYLNPIFLTLKSIHLLDTQLGLILVYLTFSLPLPIWFLSQYFKNIPIEFDDAAHVDGCNLFQIIFRIIFPMAAPALSTSAIFVFMYTWNEFFLAGILTTKYAVTLSVGIMNFQQAHSVSWNLTTAASMIAVFPLILIIATLQKYVVSGLTAGGLKG